MYINVTLLTPSKLSRTLMTKVFEKGYDLWVLVNALQIFISVQENYT